MHTCVGEEDVVAVFKVNTLLFRHSNKLLLWFLNSLNINKVDHVTQSSFLLASNCHIENTFDIMAPVSAVDTFLYGKIDTEK